jgi:hypothetical protein
MKILKAASTAVLAAMMLFGSMSVNAAEAATPGQITSGPGWKLDPMEVTSIAPVTYTVMFDSVEARTRLTPYFTAQATEMNRHTPGTTFVVSSTIQPVNWTTPTTIGCHQDRTIVVALKYRPSSLAGIGWGGNCYNGAHVLTSGVTLLDSEWWYPNWFSTDPVLNERYIKNAVLHEFGHMVGLDHPNIDRTGDGVAGPYECILGDVRVRPVMCAPNGGRLDSGAGTFTSMDAAGLNALVTNYQYR